MGEAVRANVMVVGDDPEAPSAIARSLGCALERAETPEAVLARLATGTAEWDVLVLDVGLAGIEVLRRFRDAGSLVSIVVLADDRTAPLTECMHAGAFGYLTKPVRPLELSSTMISAARHAQLRRRLARHEVDTMLVGASPAMHKLRASLDRLASQDVSILIAGERGTGKELVARVLHQRGPRGAKPFVALDCGAIPEALIDSELFGHAKGAFAGATGDHAGVFVEAGGGTLFLDAVGELPTGVQARLLRVLQEGEVRPLGASNVRTVDARVIAATHVDLAAAVESGRFRQDLYSRLNVVAIEVPPLRDRLDDLPLLAAHFLQRHGGDSPPAFSVAALEVMSAYAWPGNVRELEAAVMRAIALDHGDVIGPESLPVQLADHRRTVVHDGHDDDPLPLTAAKRKASLSFEQGYLVRAMEKARGSVSEAARLSGLDRTNFRRLLQRHAIDPAKFK